MISIEYVTIKKGDAFMILSTRRNNPMKFQLEWIRKWTFQLKLYDTAVTLKYNKGHRKWYEQVKLNK